VVIATKNKSTAKRIYSLLELTSILEDLSDGKTNLAGLG